MKTGTRVVMSEAFKRARRGMCEGPGKHTGHGPTWAPDPEMPDDGCAACSWDHIEEFGGCTGTVQGPMFESSDAPEVDVRWEPSGLRYGYHPDDLVEVGTYDPAERAREKQASRDQDEADLAAGRKTRDDLRCENGAFSGLNVRVNLRPVSR